MACWEGSLRHRPRHVRDRFRVAAEHAEGPRFSIPTESAFDRRFVSGQRLRNAAGNQQPLPETVEGVRLRRSQLDVGFEGADRVFEASSVHLRIPVEVPYLRGVRQRRHCAAEQSHATGRIHIPQ
jgi:hypothetical protein